MDKDQDLYTNDDSEQFDAPQGDAAQDPFRQPNEHKHFMTLLLYLEQALEYGSPMPLTNKRLVDYEECMEIIDNMRGNLPLAIQYASELVADRANILGEAQERARNRIDAANANADSIIDAAQNQAQLLISEAESHADKLIKDAEIRARSLLDQNSIKIAAQNEARDIVNRARAQANELQLTASAYSENLLLNIERELLNIVDKVRAKRRDLGEGE